MKLCRWYYPKFSAMLTLRSIQDLECQIEWPAQYLICMERSVFPKVDEAFQSQLQLPMLLADIQKLIGFTFTHALGTICSILTASDGRRKATY